MSPLNYLWVAMSPLNFKKLKCPSWTIVCVAMSPLNYLLRCNVDPTITFHQGRTLQHKDSSRGHCNTNDGSGWTFQLFEVQGGHCNSLKFRVLIAKVCIVWGGKMLFILKLLLVWIFQYKNSEKVWMMCWLSHHVENHQIYCVTPNVKTLG